MAFQLISAEAACTALPTTAFRSAGNALYLVLLNQDLELLAALMEGLQHADLRNIGKPSTLSELVLLNSAASGRPRSIAATISPPGQCIHGCAERSEMSMERPTVRYFRPLKSSTLVTVS